VTGLEVTRVHHTGVVVRSIAETLQLYRDKLGMRLVKEATMEDQGVKAALLHLGNSFLELLEPIDPDFGIARYLEKRGEGLHHVCLEVVDIHASLAHAKAQGLELIDEAPREGLTGQIAFIHPNSVHGVLVELVHGPSALPLDS
jgi:methylmalonyl-CoA epimerase